MRSRTIEVNRVQVTCYEDGSVEWIHGWTGKIRRKFGGYDSHGYMRVMVGGKSHRVHRLIARAFLDEYSEELDVDHINGNRIANNPSNLRMLTRAQNLRAYRRPSKGSSSKYRGVSMDKRRNKWCAYIKPNEKKISLGYFESEIDAAKAYDNAAILAGYLPETLNLNKLAHIHLTTCTH